MAVGIVQIKINHGEHGGVTEDTEKNFKYCFRGRSGIMPDWYIQCIA
jgi:hypothetical protein